MHSGRAFVAGVIGTLAMSLVMLGFRADGVIVPIEAGLASVVGSHAWGIGFTIHLAIGGLLGIAYAAVFEYVMHQSGIGVGVLLGALNTIFAGFVWAAIGGPGAFWETVGPQGVIALFAAHLVYGAVVGGVYRSEQVPIYG